MNITLVPENLFRIGPLTVTNTLLTAWIIVVGIGFSAFIFSKRLKPVPGRLQNLVEMSLEAFLGLLETIAGSREKARKYFPLTATIFIFVLLSNWIGILPGVGSIGFYRAAAGGKEFVPFFRSVYSDLNMTLALALISVTLTHVFALSAIGIRRHLGKFLNVKSPMGFFVGVLEIIGEFSKIISFSFRLFGNVFAGEVLLATIAFLVPYIAPLPFLGMELFVGFIQAFIFSALTMAFISTATEDHEAEAESAGK